MPVGADHLRVTETATIDVHAGTSSVDLPLTATIRLVGPSIGLRDRPPSNGNGPCLTLRMR